MKDYKKETVKVLRSVSKNLKDAGFKTLPECPKCGENSLMSLRLDMKGSNYCMLCGYRGKNE